MPYVQFGSGYSAPAGWTNFDASLTLRFERLPIVGRLYTKNPQRFPKQVTYGDVVAGLPVASSTCDGVYASHVLEHLALQEFRRALREVFRILAPGGIFRLVVPDLRLLADDYLKAARRGDPEAAHRFMRATHLGSEARPRSLLARAAVTLGGSRHLWMWDEAALSSELSSAGYIEIRRAELGDSGDSAFDAVEDPARFVAACAMQARRPTRGC